MFLIFTAGRKRLYVCEGETSSPLREKAMRFSALKAAVRHLRRLKKIFNTKGAIIVEERVK